MDFIYKQGDLRPFWQGNTVVAETVIITKKDGVISGTLWRAPEKILKVTDYRRQVEYTLDKDFTINSNIITLTPNSQIKYMPFAKLLGEWTEEDVRFPTVNRVDTTHYGEDTLLPDHQICVTYTHSGTALECDLPAFQLPKLNNVANKLNSKKDLRILFYGDSISTGCNTSAHQNIPPFMPTWMRLVTDNLSSYYGSKIEYLNTAVGGMDACWGLENVDKNVISQNADLVILAFGMNDGVVYDEQKFNETILAIINATRAKNPNTEFVLVSSILPNPYATTYEFKPFFGNQRKFGRVLKNIANTNNAIAFCDVGAIHEQLLKTKFYADMLVNNINHPNDYLAKIYAMSILQTLIK